MDGLIVLSLAIAALAIAIAFSGDFKRAGYIWLSFAAFAFLLVVGGVRSLEHGTLTGAPLSLLLFLVNQLSHGTLSLITVASQVRATLIWASLILIPIQFGYLMYSLAIAKAKHQITARRKGRML